MRSLLLIIFLLPLLLAGQSLTPVQQKNIYKAAQLWGRIKYVHPWLAYKDIRFDEAFAGAVPSILAAKDPQGFAAALQQWISVLGDSATQVQYRTSKRSSLVYTNAERGKAYLQDSVLVVRLNEKITANDFNETVEVMATAAKLLPGAVGVVFDLRLTEPGSRLSHSDELNIEFSTTYYGYHINSSLCAAALQLPSLRTVMHEGYIMEANSIDAYQSFMKSSYARVVPAGRPNAIPIVFLLNQNVATPEIAFTLQKTGAAVILTEEANIEQRALPLVQLPLDSNISVYIRTADLVEGNEVLSVRADTVLIEVGDYNTNLQTAIARAKRPMHANVDEQALPIEAAPRWKPPVYSPDAFPGLGERVLAAAKMYAVIDLFSPNKDLMDTPWDTVLFRYLPLFIAAKDRVAYTQAVAGMYAHIQDSHGFADAAVQPALSPLFGKYASPSVRVSRIGKQYIISYLLNDSAAKAEGLHLGDWITKVDGRDLDSLAAAARVYYPGSNAEAQDRFLDWILLTGNDSSKALLTVKAPGGSLHTVKANRSALFRNAWRQSRRPLFKKEMPVCSLLPGNIGFIDLVQLQAGNLDSVMEFVRNTRGLILDDRSYPGDAANKIFNYLPAEKTSGAKRSLLQPIVDADIITPSAQQALRKRFIDISADVPIERKWIYKGKLTVLYNEFTQSAAEGLAARLERAGAVGVGAHTAGANGDISNFNIPGRINLSFTGRKTSMQRTGLIPAIKALPSINGIKQGRDEVIERAVQYINAGK